MMFNNTMPGFDKITDLNKQMMTSFAEMTELAANAQRKMATQQMAAFEANMGAAHKVLDAMIEGKQPAEVYAVQVETTQALGEEMAGFARESWEAQTDLRDKVVSFLSEKAQMVAEPVKKAATRAKKVEA
jgi:hypothetical protein